MEDKNFNLKHRLIFGAIVSAFFCFTLLTYSPLSLYVKGNDEMWFSFRSLLLPVISVSIVAFLAITAALSFPKKGIHKLLCCLTFGVTVGLYIQCSFFNISYGSGVLDGSQIAWKDYTTYGAIDSAMWAACLALPFALYMVFKRSWRQILIAIAAFVFILQIGGLALGVYQNSNSLDKLSHEVSVDGMYELSEDDNTLVFVLGAMDKDYYDTYKESNPEITDELSGFTEYTNVLSTGSDSLISFPAMLTGEVYKKDTKYSEYISSAWNKENVFDLLDRNGVDVRIYSDDKYFDNSTVRKVDNIVDRAQDSNAYNIIGSTMYRYTMYNAAPHYLKQLFWMSLNDYSSIKSNNTYSTGRDDKFFSGYEDNVGFTYTDKYSSAVRIYELKGAEMPYRLNSQGEIDTDGTSLDEQIEGDFYYIRKIINDLKDSGKYDSTRIIIVGENGDLEYGQKPMLLYKKSTNDLEREAEKESTSDTAKKPAKTEKAETKLTLSAEYKKSDAPVSLFDFPSTLAATVTNDYASIGTGKSFSDTEKLSWNRRRFFYRNTGSNANSRVEMYKANSPAIDETDLKLVGEYYVNGGKIDDYVLGTELTFTEDETAAIYCKEGFGHTNGWRTIVRSSPAVMEIPFAQIPNNIEDLHAYFSVLNVYQQTRCVITANGTPVFDDKLDTNVRMNGLNFLIPANVIGRDKTITLKFSFPDLPDEETDIIALTSFKIYNQ